MREINDRPDPIWTCQRGGVAKIITIHCPLSNCIFLTTPCPPPLFNFFFLQWWPEQELHGILFYYVVPKFTAYGFKRFNNKNILQKSKKSILVEIMSWNVMDEVVLQSPEGVSAGGPPAINPFIMPSRSEVGRSLPVALLLKYKNSTSEKNHFNF